LFEIDFEPRDPANTLPKHSALKYWWQLLKEAMPHKSIVCQDFEAMLRAAGFVDVRQHSLELPLNSWKPGRRETAANYASILAHDVSFDSPSMLEGMSLAPFTRNKRWTREQLDVTITDALNEVHNPVHHVYHVL
jgi:hypothetical protein